MNKLDKDYHSNDSILNRWRLLLPNINVPIERNNIKNWIKTTQFFNIKTNNIKEKQQKIIEPSPQDKLVITKQEINKISDNYTFIDDKNTLKHFQTLNKEALILNYEKQAGTV
jgi:hypothetical protein